MIENSTTEIDGVKYTYRPVGAKKARIALITLVNTLGPVFGNGLTNLDSDKVKGVDLDGEALAELMPALAGSFGTMINTFSKAVSPEFYDRVVETFVSRIELHEGDKLISLNSANRDERFATKLLTESKLLVWALSEQYSDFFGSWRQVSSSALAGMMKKTQSHSKSPQASTGTVTESPQANTTQPLY